MKIAFTAKGTEWSSMMDPRFGRTEFILIYDEEKEELTNYDNRAIESIAHGAGPQIAQKLFDLVKVEKNCGDKPPRSFSDYDVTIGNAPDRVELNEML